MAIDTHLDATPSDITASATAIGTIKTNVDSAEDDLISARKSACELEGSSAVAALSSLSTAVDGCEDLVTDLGDYKTALDNLASALSSIDTDLQGIRDQATAGGLTLNGETVVEPKSSYPLGANPDNSVEVYENSVEQDRISLYKNLETQTSDIRTREKEARQAFSDACAKIGTNPIAHAASNAVKGYFIPDTRAGGWVGAARAGTWGISRTRDIASLVEAAGLRASSADVTRTLKYTKYVTNRSANAGRHALRGITKTTDVVTEAGGKGTQQWRHALSDRKLSNWSPTKAAEGSTGAKVVDTVRKAGKPLKWAGRAGTAVSFGVDAYEQWQKDSKDPSIGQGEKVARAATKGAGSAAGGWAGAQAGAAIGACVGGPVGAAVGGIVGGVVGSGAGKALADKALGWFH
ncbi:hypothetical protein [Actinomyces gerencseriae]|uniref:hypothetical protein n=1 Tax=Actinomyces gerencseriae TaxID=52769 RepID=UPI00047B8CD6|nr:hypothetical protein [Actinomyces gerencseriae]